ncbi:MAG TPA: NAD-dependent epimerase/dehydratase family protein [Anaerolineales bacterium]|nr:NAD-dependent epimerase/dehydratase family protein [Anaerolineales bacterium]
MKSNPLAEDLDHVLDHTRDLWDELRGQQIFITGGTGFFGCWLLESFLWANEKLNLKARATVLTRSPDAFRIKAPHLTGNEAVTLLQGDVRAFDFPASTFSHVIHAATESSTANRPTPSNLLFYANLQGTMHVLELCQQCGTKKLLFTSSGAIYGKQPPEITHLSEDYQGAPLTTDVLSAYGESKRASEFLCIATAQSSVFEAKIARCFAFVGPYLPLNTTYAIGNFIRDALNSRPITMKGDGTPYRSYLYAADLAIWLWTILFRGSNGRAYNVGSDSELNIAQLANTVRNIINPNCEIIMAGKPEMNLLANRYIPSISRARLELGLDDCIKLNEAIRRTKEWYMERIHD